MASKGMWWTILNHMGKCHSTEMQLCSRLKTCDPWHWHKDRHWGPLLRCVGGGEMLSFLIPLFVFFVTTPAPITRSDFYKFSSVAQSCPTLCDPMNRSTPGLPVHHQLLMSTQTHVHWVSDAIQLSHPLSSPSPPALNLSQHQGLFQWVSSSRQVTKIWEFQL